MKRNFVVVLDNIVAIATEEQREAIYNGMDYCDPSCKWDKLAEIVKRIVTPNSKDAQSIAIYAELCGIGMAEMKAKFEANGQ